MWSTNARCDRSNKRKILFLWSPRLPRRHPQKPLAIVRHGPGRLWFVGIHSAECLVKPSSESLLHQRSVGSWSYCWSSSAYSEAYYPDGCGATRPPKQILLQCHHVSPCTLGTQRSFACQPEEFRRASSSADGMLEFMPTGLSDNLSAFDFRTRSPFHPRLMVALEALKKTRWAHPGSLGRSQCSWPKQ